MKIMFAIVAILLLPTLALAQAPDAAPSVPVELVELAAFEPTREEAVLEAYVDGIVAAHMREHDIPGTSVSIVKDGKVLFAKGYGFTDLDAGTRANGEDSLFRIGSVSKTFIWTAVMMLVERGEIDLDADVNSYLDGVVVPEKFGAPVTMNQLMAHRAGFEDSFGVFTIPREGDIALTDALNKNMPKRVFPPGTRTSYSNWGSALAAKIIEDVTGETYADFLFLEILNPLGMNSTALFGPDSMPSGLRARLSKGYELKSGDLVETDFMKIGPYAPAGAMSMSATDMARWMQLHLNGGSIDGVRLMTPQTHARMWSRAFRDRPAAPDLAHGFFSRNYRGYDAYGHGGATAAFFAYMDLIPSLNLGVYVSQNATTDRALVSDLSQLVIDHLVDHKTTEPIAADAATMARANEAVGSYLANRRSFSQFEKVFALTAETNVRAGGNGSVIVTNPNGSILYRPVSNNPDIYENRYGARVSFGRDDKGKITHLSGPMGVHSSDQTSLLASSNLFNGSIGAAIFFALTTIAGSWRRQGRDVAQTKTGKILGLGAFGGAILVFGLMAAFAAMIARMGSIGVADIVNYPLPIITTFRMIATIFVVFVVIAIGGLIPTWRLSGWSLWRKGHHTVFVLALTAMAFMLVQWKFVFSATA